MILGSNLALSKINERSWWLSDRKNWAMSKAKMLVWRSLTYPVQIRWVKYKLASRVDYCFKSQLIVFKAFLSGVVHTGVEVRRMNSEMSRLVERPWLQLIYCTVCLPHGRNFRWWEKVRDESECWWVYCHWTPEIEFNKSLSSSIIRLANYNVTTSLIYKQIV